jgi:hypothetical protein
MIGPNEPEAAVAKSRQRIDTGGGNYIGSIRGHATVGDIVAGDKVAGNKVTNSPAGELAALFQQIYAHVDAMPTRTDVDRSELRATVSKVEREAARGERADANKIGSWLRMIGGLVPDVARVVAAALLNPVAGVATAVQVVAQRVAGGTGP